MVFSGAIEPRAASSLSSWVIWAVLPFPLFSIKLPFGTSGPNTYIFSFSYTVWCETTQGIGETPRSAERTEGEGRGGREGESKWAVGRSDGAERAGENMKCMGGDEKMEETHGGVEVERFTRFFNQPILHLHSCALRYSTSFSCCLCLIY